MLCITSVHSHYHLQLEAYVKGDGSSQESKVAPVLLLFTTAFDLGMTEATLHSMINSLA